MEYFRRYTYAYPSGTGGYEPSFALACYLAWRDVDWKKEVRSPRPGILQWNELAADFTSMEPRELSVEPGLLNFRSPWVSSSAVRLSALHDFAAA